MADYSPHEFEMWLDLERIPHRASSYFTADRKNPSGIEYIAALLIPWLVIFVLLHERCHILSCDGVTVGSLGRQNWRGLTADAADLTLDKKNPILAAFTRCPYREVLA